jgi:hypothetical protein
MTVQRRKVFFIGGFDPRRPTHYHALYAEHAPLQAALTGVRYQVSPKPQVSPTAICWQVDASTPQGAVTTEVQCLRWDDLVRQRWPRTALALARETLIALRAGLGSGAIWRLTKLNLRVVFAGLLMPILAVLLALILGLALCVLAAALTAANGALVQGLVAGLSALLWAKAARIVLTRLNLTWFLRVSNFAAQHAHGEWHELPARMQAFAERIHQCLNADEHDEVLLVGYSAGAVLGASVLGEVLNLSNATAVDPSKLSYISLGNCLPAFAAYPAAKDYRGVVSAVMQSGMRWVDFTSPIDWGSFACTNPLATSPNDLSPSGELPGCRLVMKSPQFHLLFDAKRYAALKLNKFAVHQQYLKSTQFAGGYDYFALTAGSQMIAQRLGLNPHHE